jgi:hypothetical protein
VQQISNIFQMHEMLQVQSARDETGGSTFGTLLMLTLPKL